MGQVNTEQAIEIFNAGAEAVTNVQPDPEPNYWWLMLIAVVPVILAPFVATWFHKRKANK